MYYQPALYLVRIGCILPCVVAFLYVRAIYRVFLYLDGLSELELQLACVRNLLVAIQHFLLWYSIGHMQFLFFFLKVIWSHILLLRTQPGPFYRSIQITWANFSPLCPFQEKRLCLNDIHAQLNRRRKCPLWVSYSVSRLFPLLNNGVCPTLHIQGGQPGTLGRMTFFPTPSLSLVGGVPVQIFYRSVESYQHFLGLCIVGDAWKVSLS
jgi:hypothetical protein